VMDSGEANPVVTVAWLSTQVDLARSAEGKAVWSVVEPTQWAVSVMSLDDLPVLEDKPQQIGDLQVVFHPGNPAQRMPSCPLTTGSSMLSHPDCAAM